MTLRTLAHRFAFEWSTQDALENWARHETDLVGCRMVLSEPRFGASHLPGRLAERTFGAKPQAYLNSLFSPHAFFFTNEVIRAHMRGSDHPLALDHTISMDSNFVGAVRTFLGGKSLGEREAAFLQATAYLCANRLNLDAIPYLAENLDRARSNARHREFTIDGFAAFYRFSSARLRTPAPSGLGDFDFILSKEEARRHAETIVHDFMEDVQSRDSWFRRDIHLVLLFTAIEFYEKRHTTVADKMLWLMCECERTVGRIPERELLLALKAFQDAEDSGFFKDNWPVPYNREQNILELIRNMSWDLTFYRHMETWATKNDSSDFTLPFFLTFDRRMASVGSVYASKVMLIDDIERTMLAAGPMSVAVEFEKLGCSHEANAFYEPQRVAERLATRKSGAELDSYRQEAESRLHHVVYG